jgi:hypothetical protein
MRGFCLACGSNLPDDQLCRTTRCATEREINQLRSELSAARAVVETANNLRTTLSSVYLGTPSKLDWPEWHYFEQALAAYRQATEKP